MPERSTAPKRLLDSDTRNRYKGGSRQTLDGSRTELGGSQAGQRAGGFLAPRSYEPENSSSSLPQERTNGGSGGRDDVNGRKARHLDGVVWKTERMERRGMKKRGGLGMER